MTAVIEVPENLPEAWTALLLGLALLARGQSNDISPFNCTHDELTVMADPAVFTAEELEALETLGFFAGQRGTEREMTFYSTRFGSA